MMKTKDILKKVELFEKLAIYGRRTDFLQSLAQEYSSQEELSNAHDYIINQLNIVSNIAGVSSLPQNADMAQIRNKVTEIISKSRKLDSNKIMEVNKILNPIISVMKQYNNTLQHYTSLMPNSSSAKSEDYYTGEEQGQSIDYHPVGYYPVGGPTQSVYPNKAVKDSVLPNAKKINQSYYGSDIAPTKTQNNTPKGNLKLNKYYHLINKAKMMISRIDILNPSVHADAITLSKIYYDFLNIRNNLNKFKQEFPTQNVGEIKTLSDIIDNLVYKMNNQEFKFSEYK